MSTVCPKCAYDPMYEDNGMMVCPICAYEEEINKEEVDNSIKDANGNVLQDGDSVSVIKDLKVKGSSSGIKVGTKVKNIKLIYDSSDGHNIDCKVDGIGAMKLKSEFVKKLK